MVNTQTNKQLVKKRPKSNFDKENRLWLFMSKEEEDAYFAEVLERVARDPRWYLDNLSELSVFRVRFENYKPKKKLFKQKTGGKKKPL